MIIRCNKDFKTIKAGDYLRAIEVSEAAHGHEPGYYVKHHGELPSEALRVSAATFHEHFTIIAK